MGNDGFKNENLMLESLNNKKFSELNDNLQQMIVYMADNAILPNTLIKAYKIGGKEKTDLIVEIDNQPFNISIKKGMGNSVHQEKVEDFIDFLEKEFDITKDLANDIRFFIWCDGTIDGSGKLSDRVGASQFKKKYPKITNNLRQFFHNNKRKLIERFVIKGPRTNLFPDFIYYGTPNKGFIIKSKNAINWLCEDNMESKKAAVPVGRLTFQPWNPVINGNPKREHCRGQIQLKWSSICKDLILINEYAKNKK